MIWSVWMVLPWFASVAWAETTTPYQVEGPARVLAGDILDIEDQRPYRNPRFDAQVRVHVRGVDAPEPSQTCIVEEKRWWFCGTAAQQALSQWINNRPVLCTALATTEQDRTFGVCRVGQEDLATWLVAHGWALADPKTGERYLPLEEKAKKDRVGIWKSRFEPPWEFRKQSETLYDWGKSEE
ncbi:MAG: thermonuclease family protein [Magnetococcales bacterium]|nr:thermonuclease family protein [Magnetococcales bacterium]